MILIVIGVILIFLAVTYVPAMRWADRKDAKVAEGEARPLTGYSVFYLVMAVIFAVSGIAVFIASIT